MNQALLAAAAAGRTILAPNAELAAAMFDAVDRAHRDAGDEIWPTPRVLDLSNWLRARHLERQLADADSPRLLSEVEERELWRAVIDAAEHGRDYLDPAGAARAARRARRALRDHDIPLEALKSEVSEETHAFLAWNHAFETRCRELNCISADELLPRTGTATDGIDWIESPHWRPVARRWLESLGRPLLPLDSPAGTVSLISPPTGAEELSAMADWARQRSAADERFRAWIGVPDLSRRRAEVIDAFDAALAPRRFGLGETRPAVYAVAGGDPLSDYAPVRAALEFLQASSGSVPFTQFSALLRSRELHGTEADAGSAARLDAGLRRRASNEADFKTWLALAERVASIEEHGASAILERLSTAHGKLSQLHGARRLSEWGAAWIAALEAGPWAFRARWSSIEFQSAERFRELLATLASGDAVFGPQQREAAQRILSRAARETPFQVQTGVPRIWVSGQVLDPFLNYDGLWVGNCSDEQWPPPIAPLPLLPIRLQRRYGVVAAGAGTQLALAQDIQARWLRRAGQCVFSYPQGAEGGMAAPSPLLPPRATPLVLTDATPQPHWHAMQRSAPALEAEWDELAPPYSASERNRGVATLRAQSRCAFRGFAETRLNAEILELPVPGFNERERGEIVHAALEHVWSELRDSEGLRALNPLQEGLLLNDAASHALDAAGRRRDPGKRWREREHIRLQNLLAKWLEVERLRAPFSVEALEVKEQVASLGALEFAVRIDRIDRLADNARVLLDYKTGAAGRDWRGERPENPQLPIYALLRPEALVAVAYARVNAAEAGFVAESERPGVFPASHPTKLEGMSDFASLIAVWSKRMQRLAGEFTAGHAEVAPTLKACKSCHLQGLCRVPAALEEPDDFHE